MSTILSNSSQVKKKPPPLNITKRKIITADHPTSCDRYPPLFYQASIITGACDMPDSFAIKVSYVALFYIYCGDLTVVLSSLYFSLEHIFIGESLHK